MTRRCLFENVFQEKHNLGILCVQVTTYVMIFVVLSDVTSKLMDNARAET